MSSVSWLRTAAFSLGGAVLVAASAQVAPPASVVLRSSDSHVTAPKPSKSPEAEESEAPESPEPTEAPESPEPADSASPDDGHGAIVSTVAHCAPHGTDPLLSVDGAPANHGGYVSVAAQGGSLTTPWGTFDLSTQAGADALCSALDAARAALPTPTPEATSASHGKVHHEHEKGAHGKH